MLLKRSRSSGDYEEVLSPLFPLAPSAGNRKSRSLDYGRSFQMPSSIPEGWSFDINEEGRGVFVNQATEQKVCIALDKVLFFCQIIIFLKGKTVLHKMIFFNLKVFIFFLLLHENIRCGYSLEVPR